MPEESKFLYRTKAISEIIGAVFLPIIVAVVGWHLATVQQNQEQAEQNLESERKEIDRADQLMKLMDRLSAGDTQTREGALFLVKHYASNCADAEIVLPVLFEGLRNPAGEVKSDTNAVLKQVHTRCKELQQEIETGWAVESDEPEKTEKTTEVPSSTTKPTPTAFPTATPLINRFASPAPTPSNPSLASSGLSPRVYIHIRDEDQRTIAEELEKTLEAAGVLVPKIVRVDFGPSTTQLRFFRPEDEHEADKIDGVLSAPGVSVVHVSGYENSTEIRPHHFELWLAPGFSLPNGTQPVQVPKGSS